MFLSSSLADKRICFFEPCITRVPGFIFQVFLIFGFFEGFIFIKLKTVHIIYIFLRFVSI